MTGYTVDVDALNELRSKMQAYLAHCETSLSRVESLIGQVSQSWDGAAAEAYEARHRNWVRSAHDMRTALADFTAHDGPQPARMAMPPSPGEGAEHAKL